MPVGDGGLYEQLHDVARQAVTDPVHELRQQLGGPRMEVQIIAEHTLRQSVLALTAGTALAEHENPGDATLLVLRVRVRLTSGGSTLMRRSGKLIVIPRARCGLQAIEGAVLLLTVVERG